MLRASKAVSIFRRQTVFIKSPISHLGDLSKPPQKTNNYAFLVRFYSSRENDRNENEESHALATVSQCDESKSTSDAIVTTHIRYDKIREVIVVPLTEKPAFPGLYRAVAVTDPKSLGKILENKESDKRLVGAFLLKDFKPAQTGFFPYNQGERLKGIALYNRLHEYGTLCKVRNVTTIFDPPQVVLQGHVRLRLKGIVSEDPLIASVEWVKDKPFDPESDVLKATLLEAISTMQTMMMLSPFFREGISQFLQSGGSLHPSQISDCSIGLSTSDGATQQQGLEELDVLKRLNMGLTLLKKDLDIYKLQASIAKSIEEKIVADQRRHFLMEQMKAIKKELGMETDQKTALTERFRERLQKCKAKCPEHILQVIEEELAKLQIIEPSSIEFNMTRNYLDWLTSMPWGQYSKENFEVTRARKILDEDHYGLSDIKERILEFIAVGKLKGSVQGKIICLSGPPGVGKTSIGRSIAKALNRSFFRFSVGGLSDVAEIKGHRRTYVGAMPGKMIECLKTTGTANPLVLIDEIDKLGRGHAGDPASALLELLDPEQNANFLDHYLDVPIDLSKVLFVCTANVVENIPGPLVDRMEVIRLAGYTSDEKLHIARGYLEVAARGGCGIKLNQATITETALHTLIEKYCREAGVRNLQKHIEKIYRKIALKLVSKDVENKGKMEVIDATTSEKTSGEEVVEEAQVIPADDEEEKKASKYSKAKINTRQIPSDKISEDIDKIIVDESNLPEYVGNAVFQNDRIYDQTPVGVVMGLAWTAMGGSTLYVETKEIEQAEGKGSLKLTGQLGDVMKESASIAYTVSRSILRERDPLNPFFKNTSLHLHVPAGATPKDGPSAGCTMTTSLLSLAMNKAVKNNVAMTGELSLTGRVLPIGGVKEKTIAAKRSGVTILIFPKANKPDFDELLPHIKEGFQVHLVEHYMEVFKLAFEEECN